TESTSQFEIWWTFGWPYETSAAMARIVFAGLFDKHPGLKIITHHMGGMVPYFEGRVGHGWDQLGTRTSGVDLTEVLRTLERRPIDFLSHVPRGYGALRRRSRDCVRAGFLRRRPCTLRV